MPSTDIAKIALIVLLIAAVAGAVGWFMTSVAGDVVDTGVAATAALDLHAAPVWQSVTSLFGASWGLAWDIALAIVLTFIGIMFAFRVIRWVNGA